MGSSHPQTHNLEDLTCKYTSLCSADFEESCYQRNLVVLSSMEAQGLKLNWYFKRCFADQGHHCSISSRSRAATIHRCTAIFYVTIPISIFEWDIVVSQNNKIFLIKNQKLCYQHSQITVLISLMTPYPSTSLFLATGLCPCLVSLCVLPITYCSRWRHEHRCSSNKLSADTVLCANSKNIQFIHQNVFL